MQLSETQGDDAWHDARSVMPTASRFKELITPKQRKVSASLEGYALEMAANVLYGRLESWGGNSSTDRGHGFEPDARRWYEAEKSINGRECEVIETGFHTDLLGRWGCSPDGCVYDDPEGHGGVEIKCFERKHHLEAVVHWHETRKQLPDQEPQTYGQLLTMEEVDDWKWVDTVYWHPDPRIKNICVRTYRDDEFMETLEDAILMCCDRRDHFVKILESI